MLNLKTKDDEIMTYYAVIRGKNPGIYTNNHEATEQILGYSGSLLKSFATLSEAEKYCKSEPVDYEQIAAAPDQEHAIKKAKKKDLQYYAVASGRQTGIFTSLELAQQQVLKFPNAKWHRFNNLVDAERYLMSEKAPNSTKIVTRTKSHVNREYQLGSNIANSHLPAYLRSPTERLLRATLKKMGEQRYYAVRIGRKPGIYTDFNEAKKQTDGYSGALAHTFNNMPAAKQFMRNYHLTKPDNEMFATIYTDGGFRTNRHGGWAFLITSRQKPNVYDTGGVFNAIDNNQMELLALRNALYKLLVLGYNKEPLRFVLDSQYVVSHICDNSIIKWEQQNWDTEYGELWHEVTELLAEFDQVCFKWTKGHSGNLGNVFVDKRVKRCLDHFSLLPVVFQPILLSC